MFAELMETVRHAPLGQGTISGHILKKARLTRASGGTGAVTLIQRVGSAVRGLFAARGHQRRSRTVELHRARVMRKLGMRSLAQLVRVVGQAKKVEDGS